jgi:hypothetical protein
MHESDSISEVARSLGEFAAYQKGPGAKEPDGGKPRSDPVAGWGAHKGLVRQQYCDQYGFSARGK